MTQPTPDAVFDAIVQFARERSTGDAPVIERTSTLKDVGLTSLDAIELLFEIEERFGITLPENGPDFANDTVQHLVDAVCAPPPAAA